MRHPFPSFLPPRQNPIQQPVGGLLLTQQGKLFPSLSAVIRGEHVCGAAESRPASFRLLAATISRFFFFSFFRLFSNRRSVSHAEAAQELARLFMFPQPKEDIPVRSRGRESGSPSPFSACFPEYPPAGNPLRRQPLL